MEHNMVLVDNGDASNDDFCNTAYNGASSNEDVDDDEGMNPDHIDIVLEQCNGKTRAQVVRALKDADGDLVNAIMELSMG